MLDDQNILKFLRNFSPISLDELDSYGLMNRVDTKYVFSSGKIPQILKDLGGNYKALEIESNRIFTYCTTYFDTPDWLFFRQHVTERGERNKVRFRKYEQSGVSFLEVKKRTNKLRTEKWRILKDVNSVDCFDQESLKFIRRYIEQDLPGLCPVLVNRFNRITLAAIDSEERITIDFDLIFNDLKGNDFELPALCIIERKRAVFSNRSLLTAALKKNSIYPTGFSKYCLGAAVLYKLPRQNTVKPKLLLINRISNEYTNNSHGQHYN